MRRGRDIFYKFKPIINVLTKVCSAFPLPVRKWMFLRARYKKGLYGIGIRYVLLKAIAKQCGDNVLINEGCFILYPEKMIIGNNVSIQPMSYLDAAGGIEIGNDVSLAHGSTVMSSTHNYQHVSLPTRDQGCALKTTRIGNNVWIGAKTTILYGTTIGDNTIIGAGSVVTKSLEGNFSYVGVPAKVLKRIRD